MTQSTNTLFMVRPAHFGYNPETAISNHFQNDDTNDSSNASQLAIAEFDRAVTLLITEGVSVLVIQDSDTPVKPDAIFPNNWISTHHDGTIVLYPMCTPNRRIERENDLLMRMQESFMHRDIIDLTHYEGDGRFLEGTGSIVFDHDTKTAFACRSQRTDEGILSVLCNRLGYRYVAFDAYDQAGQLIYHTNVIMAIGKGYALVCLSCIHDDEERSQVIDRLQEGGKEIIDISLEQVYQFAGNALEVLDKQGHHVLVMSQRAYGSLTDKQVNSISVFARILPIPVDNIEHIGGGSIRCMMGQIFLQSKGDI